MPNIYRNIDGWFDFDDVYNEMVEKFHKGGHFVEIGVWFGRSSVYLLEKIKETAAKITVDFIDHWQGDPDVPYQQNIVKQKTPEGICKEFCANVQKADPNWVGKLHSINSLEACKLYENESLEMVFLDSSHYIENTGSEIQTWLPKIKIGGFLGGHDYEQPNVHRAVHEIFGVLPARRHTWLYEKVKQ